MSVNRERVELLCRALESGEFRQAPGALRVQETRSSPEGYCCLGVATVVALRNGLQLTGIGSSEDDVWDHDLGEVLHPEVRDWYGFEYEDPEIQVTRDPVLELSPTIPATEANDGIGHDGNENPVHRYPFIEIAAGFRRTYLGQDPS